MKVGHHLLFLFSCTCTWKAKIEGKGWGSGWGNRTLTCLLRSMETVPSVPLFLSLYIGFSYKAIMFSNRWPLIWYSFSRSEVGIWFVLVKCFFLVDKCHVQFSLVSYGVLSHMSETESKNYIHFPFWTQTESHSAGLLQSFVVCLSLLQDFCKYFSVTQLRYPCVCSLASFMNFYFFLSYGHYYCLLPVVLERSPLFMLYWRSCKPCGSDITATLYTSVIMPSTSAAFLGGFS